MGRRKGSNTAQTSTNSSNQFEGTKIRFQDADDDGVAAESFNLDESILAVDKATEDISMGEPDVSFVDSDAGDDKTSADYYFDSYSHFGIFSYSSYFVALIFYCYLSCRLENWGKL